MDVWQLVKTPNLPGAAHMRLDLELFKYFEKGPAVSTLHIYSWRPNCISLGYSQDIATEVDVKKAAQLGWDVVQRPTGGGIVFHNEAEITYSLVTAIDNPMLPKGLVPSYIKISDAVICGLSKIGIAAEIRNQKTEIRNISEIRNSKHANQLCFSFPAEYEIVIGKNKIVGSAQKRGKKALLQQGSIFVRNTKIEAFSVLNKRYDKLDVVSVEDVLGREMGFVEMSRALVAGFTEVLGIKFDEKT